MRVLLCLLLLSCGSAQAPVESGAVVSAAPPMVPSDSPGALGATDPALRDLLHRHWEATLQRWPTWATTLGDHRFDDRLPDATQAASDAWHTQLTGFLQEAKALDRATLNSDDALTVRLFEEDLASSVEAKVCRTDLWAISPRSNAYGGVSDLAVDLPPTSPKAMQNLQRRYSAIPSHVDAEISNLRAGLKQGLVANATSVDKVIEQLERELNKPLMEWPLWAAIRDAKGSEQDVANHTAAIEGMLKNDIQPAFHRYLTFLRSEVRPAARPEGKEGLGALPNGAACYEVLVRTYTTLPDVTAAERHARGLQELRRIHDEFRALGETALGTADLQEVFERLRTDPALHFETEQQVEDKARSALAKAKLAMPQYFGRLPQRACIVERVPEHEAPYTTIAYYQQPTPDLPGRYAINVYKPETRPRHEAEVLAYHESIPGHHLQIAISQELPDLPAFRKHGGMTAFVEGWALYTERLADEMGLYTADTDRLGMLSFDSWRAARLVVDTGIHHEGWSRTKAERFLIDNTPLAKNNIANEVDRYITTPGQALSYKTGQIVIWQLRREAEAELGERFDIKAFHDVVLGAGAVSLPVLQQRVRAWVKTQQLPE